MLALVEVFNIKFYEIQPLRIERTPHLVMVKKIGLANITPSE